MLSVHRYHFPKSAMSKILELLGEKGDIYLDDGHGLNVEFLRDGTALVTYGKIMVLDEQKALELINVYAGKEEEV